MLITCPSCATEYTIDSGRVGAQGRPVRCASCRTKWLVAAPESAEPETAPPADAGAADPSPVALGGHEGAAASDGAIAADAQTARSPAGLLAPERRGAPTGRSAPAAARPGAAFALALSATIMVAAGTIGLRDRIVRFLPETAILYEAVGLAVNLRGPALNHVRSGLQTAAADTLLVVEGEIANPTAHEIAVPRLAFAVRGPDGGALYTWTNEPPRRTLGPAETTRFRAKLASPPPEGRQVLVRFAAPDEGATAAAVVD